MSARCKITPAELLAQVDGTLQRIAMNWSRRHSLEFDDVIQEARQIVISNAPTFNPKRNTPRAWAVSQARGALRNVTRLRADQQRAVEVRQQQLMEVTHGEDLADVMRQELKERVRAALPSLPELQARLIRRFYGIDCTPAPSIEELSRLEKLHHSTISRQLDAARSALRALLSS